MKSLCLVDTSTLRHLDDIEIARKDAKFWLWQEFDTWVSQVVCDEIIRQTKRFRSSAAMVTRKAKGRTWQFNQPAAQYRAALVKANESKPMTNRTAILNGHNEGELANLLAGLDAVRGPARTPVRHVIYLTDDVPAQRFATDVFDSFKIACLWNSYDFLLYLFFRHRQHIALEEAKNAIRDLHSATHAGGMPEDATTKLQGYVSRLEAIDFFLGHLS